MLLKKVDHKTEELNYRLLVNKKVPGYQFPVTRQNNRSALRNGCFIFGPGNRKPVTGNCFLIQNFVS